MQTPSREWTRASTKIPGGVLFAFATPRADEIDDENLNCRRPLECHIKLSLELRNLLRNLGNRLPKSS
jgi:hypothetical protein